MSNDPTQIMSIGETLLERYPDTFSSDFDENKRRVEQLTDVETNRVRNRIAGYITRERTDKEAV